MSRIRIGIIGYGNSARVFHLPYIERNPDLEVVAFLQRAEPRAGGRHCKHDYPTARWHRTIDEFCADDNIDLGIVVTGHSSHAELAEKVLLSGKHVVVEKPFACSVEEADRVISIARRMGKLVVPFQNRRYDSDFRTLESLFAAKVFGEILEAEFHHDVDAPSWAVKDTGPDWHPGEGMAFGIGCHPLDQALALFGRPSTVTAFYRTLRPFPSKAEDSFTMVLQYKGTDEQEKRIVWIKTNSYSKMIPLKYFIRGREGTFIKFGEDPQEQQTYTGQSPAEPSFGVEDPSIHGELSTSRKVLDGQHSLDGKELWVGKVPSHRGDYGLFYTDLVAAIRGERELKVKPETSRDGIRIIELARLSAASGQTIMFS